MDLILAIAIVVPLLVAAVGVLVFKQTITPIEAIIQAIIPVLLITLIWNVGRYSDTWDTELWNGEVTKKEVQREACPWGWRDYQDDFCTEYRTREVRDGQTCTTTTDSKGKTKRTCVPKYKTQYSYIYPWEQKFYVYTNIKETYMIARVDAQGAVTPPFYNTTYVGEPAAARKSYTNWIRAASNNIFHEDGAAEDKYRDILPVYPNAVHDYFHVDRVVRVGGVNVPDTINTLLSDKLKQLGPKKQMNAILVVADAKTIGPDFAYALRRYWMGFKKNDAVVFLGVDGNTLKWADVMSWSKKSIFDVTLRDTLFAQVGKPVDYAGVVTSLSDVGMANYERREMKEFEYLKDQIPVPTWLTIVVLVLSIGGSIGLAILFHFVDLPNNTSRFKARSL